MTPADVSIDVQYAIPVPYEWAGFKEVVVENRDFCWLPIESASEYNELFIDDWLQTDDYTAWGMQGGFLINVDGERWNGESYDEIWLSKSWFIGLTALLHGHEQTRITPCEGDTLIAERSGDLLILREDERYRPMNARHSAPITVSFESFTHRLAHKGLALAAWIRSLHRTVHEQYPFQPTSSHSPQTRDEKLTHMLHDVNFSIVDEAEKFAALVLGK
jgi:hypothetical protein